jgi:hypothetical protein
MSSEGVVGGFVFEMGRGRKMPDHHSQSNRGGIDNDPGKATKRRPTDYAFYQDK